MAGGARGTGVVSGMWPTGVCEGQCSVGRRGSGLLRACACALRARGCVGAGSVVRSGGVQGVEVQCTEAQLPACRCCCPLAFPARCCLLPSTHAVCCGPHAAMHVGLSRAGGGGSVREEGRMKGEGMPSSSSPRSSSWKCWRPADSRSAWVKGAGGERRGRPSWFGAQRSRGPAHVPDRARRPSTEYHCTDRGGGERDAVRAAAASGEGMAGEMTAAAGEGT